MEDDAFAEYEEQCDRLRAIDGVEIKYCHGSSYSWLIEVQFVNREGVEDLYPLYTVGAVNNFLGSFCPKCRRLDGRRHTGGLCPACRRAAVSR
jgi:hypothetical protein